MDGKPYLTHHGCHSLYNEALKWDIIRIWSFMHEYNENAINLQNGDFFYGPRFYGDGLKKNIFKLTIINEECDFINVKSNALNVERAEKNIRISDWAWFKGPTGLFGI